jgi:hypothetical protein
VFCDILKLSEAHAEIRCEINFYLSSETVSSLNFAT